MTAPFILVKGTVRRNGTSTESVYRIVVSDSGEAVPTYTLERAAVDAMGDTVWREVDTDADCVLHICAQLMSPMLGSTDEDGAPF